MNRKITLILLALLAPFAGSLAQSLKLQDDPVFLKKSALQIDQHIASFYRNKSLAVPKVTDDATFLRRAFLVSVGRIPTAEEALAFLEIEDPSKRESLVDYLLKSKGHSSHMSNWAFDLLRLTDGRIGSSGSNEPYRHWVRTAMSDNMPWNEFTRSLIASSGDGWDPKTAAVGYYTRDRGMPLDNLSNTMRVFLGARMVELNYDLRAFQHVLLLTRTFQFGANPNPSSIEGSDDFHGRKIERLSSEQIWDSLITLAAGDPDKQPARSLDSCIFVGGRPVIVGKKDMVQLSKEVLALKSENELRSYFSKFLKDVKNAGSDSKSGGSMMAMSAARSYNKDAKVRASELPSPAPRDHFLYLFGTSHREVVDAFSREPNVGQVLSLMNGFVQRSGFQRHHRPRAQPPLRHHRHVAHQAPLQTRRQRSPRHCPLWLTEVPATG